MDEEVSKVLRVILRPPMPERLPRHKKLDVAIKHDSQGTQRHLRRCILFSNRIQFINLQSDVLQVLEGVLGPLLLGKAPPRPRKLHLAIDFDSKKCIYRFPRCPEGSWELREAVERN